MEFKLFSKANHLYSKLLLYLVSSIVAAVLIGTSILYVNFRNLQLSFIYSVSKDNLLQVSYSADFMVESVKSLIRVIYLDPDIAKLMHYRQPEIQDRVTAFQRLNSYSVTMPNIQSIYIYNGSSDLFYTTLTSVGIKNSAEFFDQDLVRLLKSNKIDSIFSVISRKIELPGSPDGIQQFSNVYTFISLDTANSKDKTPNAIILNISESWIREVINTLDPDTSGNIITINNNGQIVSSAYPDKMMSDISNERYISDILRTENTSGYFVGSVDGVKSLVTYVASKSLEWKFIRIIPYRVILNQLNSLTLRTIIICIFILGIGILISFLSSKRLYQPINDVVEKLKKLSNEKQENAYHLKQDFLGRILQNKLEYQDDTIPDQIDDFEIKINLKKQLLPVIFRIDQYADFCNQYSLADRSMLRVEMMKIISQNFSTTFAAETIDFNEEHLVLLLETSYPLSTDLEGMFKNLILSVQNLVQQEFHCLLSVTIASTSGSVFEISDLYNETLEASNYRLIYGYGCVLYVDQINKSLIREEYIYPVQNEKNMIDALLRGKADEAIRYYDEIIQSLNGYSYNTLNSSFLRLSFSINMAVDTIEKAGGFSISYNFNAFIAELNQCETLVEIRQRFLNMFNYIITKLEEKKSTKYEDLIKRVVKIIETNYMNKDLCLESIASSIRMSPVYLGRLFKKHMVKSVSDYINEKRMAKVLELLVSTDLSIHDISAQVGFANTNYFYTLFKKAYGITPNEYRQKAAGE